MKDSIQRSVRCTQCGELVDESLADMMSSPCPICGGTARTVHLAIEDRVGLVDSLRGKVKDQTRRSDEKLRRDFFTGAELQRSTGKFVQKDRIIDRDEDRYFEKVIDPTSGEVIHHCDEPLSQHWGHGSAKRPKSEAGDLDN
jgi:hypothetical protein